MTVSKRARIPLAIFNSFRTNQSREEKQVLITKGICRLPRAILNTRMTRISVGLMGRICPLFIFSMTIPAMDRMTIIVSNWFHLERFSSRFDLFLLSLPILEITHRTEGNDLRNRFQDEDTGEDVVAVIKSDIEGLEEKHEENDHSFPLEWSYRWHQVEFQWHGHNVQTNDRRNDQIKVFTIANIV